MEAIKARALGLEKSPSYGEYQRTPRNRSRWSGAQVSHAPDVLNANIELSGTFQTSPSDRHVMIAKRP